MQAAIRSGIRSAMQAAYLGSPAALCLLTQVFQVSASQARSDLCYCLPVLCPQVLGILLQDLGPACLIRQAKLHRCVEPAHSQLDGHTPLQVRGSKVHDAHVLSEMSLHSSRSFYKIATRSDRIAKQKETLHITGTLCCTHADIHAALKAMQSH